MVQITERASLEKKEKKVHQALAMEQNTEHYMHVCTLKKEVLIFTKKKKQCSCLGVPDRNERASNLQSS